ncbi:carbonic anhydrase [Xylogone sp. PMI_703]|nr:carbonic anhydrase [Xylogone sp. PMI_703]
MAETGSITPYVPYDYAGANRHYAEHVFPVRDPVAGSRSRCIVVTCSDPRCSPEHFFKLKEQEATVIRNEGGRAADPAVIRTVAILSAFASSAGQAIKEVLVVHHTDCTASIFTNDELMAMIAKNDADAPGGPFKPGALTWAESLNFMGIPKGGSEHDRLVRSVKQDVQFLHSHPLWRPSIHVSGWIYDINTRWVEKIEG